ncbi:MAG TPA: phenylalanine--tRNA ligase subunit beta [Candidatus Dormibacteraeota bacterium]|nr:phenylalanine--tRNA ligase subunit beta [Candidatus Dormibacteraeota bacterium]
MRVSLEWLGEFVDLGDLPPSQIAEQLTVSGTEVERTFPFAGGLDQVVVAEVVELGRLEGSDHLWMTKVRVPGQEPVEVVCGAPNLHLGAVIAWARPGTELPGGLKLGQRRIRGALSNGMICAPDELGLGTDHEGVLLLPEGEAEPGTPLSQLFPSDTILELEILSNRADCLSHWGVARELSALFRRPLHEPQTEALSRSGPPTQEAVSVRVEATEDCPIYLAECIDQLGSKPAPLWLQRRLMAVGSRSISAVVDLANYVMLEVGQPVHTFDLDRLPGGPGQIEIGVRHGRSGEHLACLDGETRPVEDALVITAAKQPVALAGIIGGSATAVQPSTTRIILEVASFNWISIRRSTRRLGIRTEASSRYERDLAPALVTAGAQRFVHLVEQVTGGRVRPGAVVDGGLPRAADPIRVSARSVSGLLGAEVDAQTAAEALQLLDFEVEIAGEDLSVQPPPSRTDVRIPVDVTEEVGRILGYDSLPSTLPPLTKPPSGSPGLVRAERLAGQICIGAGFTEAITSSLVGKEQVRVSPGLAPDIVPLSLSNPLSSQLAELRVSCLPGLLQACQLNQSRGKERIRLFEWGRVFRPSPDGAGRPEEPEVLSLVDNFWGTESLLPDMALNSLLGVVQALADGVGLVEIEFRPAPHPGFHRQRCSEVWVAGECRGVLGELVAAEGPEVELRGTTVAAELSVDGWLVDGGRPGRGVRLAKTPALSLDLAVTVPERAELGGAVSAVRALGIDELEEVRLVDLYRGKQLPEGKKGWTFRLTFRHPVRTLTHREGDQLRARVLKALATLNAVVRGGSE